MLKEFHDDDAPGTQRHKGENPENNHGYNIGLRDHLQYRYSIVQDNLQKNFTKLYVLYYNTKKHYRKWHSMRLTTLFLTNAAKLLLCMIFFVY